MAERNLVYEEIVYLLNTVEFTTYQKLRLLVWVEFMLWRMRILEFLKHP